MKRILILAGLLITTTGVFAQYEDQYTYTPTYIKNLKNCNVYQEEYTTNIPTEDPNSPTLKVKSTEEILGYINGKCYTRSTVYSFDIEKDILKIKCGLTKAQIADITRKMSKINAENSPETRKILKQDLTRFIENPEICRVKNYLQDN